MIGRVLALRRKPLASLTNGEVRLAVGQKVGFPFTLELAIDRLRADPLVEGDYYPGDLLTALVRLEETEWEGRNDLTSELTVLFRQALKRPNEETEALRDSLQLPSRNDPAH